MHLGKRAGVQAGSGLQALRPRPIAALEPDLDLACRALCRALRLASSPLLFGAAPPPLGFPGERPLDPLIPPQLPEEAFLAPDRIRSPGRLLNGGSASEFADALTRDLLRRQTFVRARSTERRLRLRARPRERARSGGRLRRVQGGETAEPAAPEDGADGRERHREHGGDLGRGHAQLPEGDDCRHAVGRRTVRDAPRAEERSQRPPSPSRHQARTPLGRPFARCYPPPRRRATVRPCSSIRSTRSRRRRG